MTIETPTEEQLDTLEKYEKKLQSVRDNITLNDAELVRIKKLNTSEEYTVKQLHNSKKALQDEIKILKNKRKKENSGTKRFAKDLSRAEKAFNDKMAEVRKAREELDKVHETKSEAAITLKTREENVVQKELSIEGEKERLRGENEKLEKNEQRVDLKLEKVRLIKDFIEKELEE